MLSGFQSWWSTVPDWAKPVILTAAITLAVAISPWIFPYMLKHFYIWILERKKLAEQQVRSERLSDGLLNVQVKSEEIRHRMTIPHWLVRRAERWRDQRKEYGI
jgi:hypothetical protein